MNESDIKKVVDVFSNNSTRIQILNDFVDKEFCGAMFSTLVDLGKLYLSTAEKMPEEKQIPKECACDGIQEKNEHCCYNQARQNCILAYMRMLPSVDSMTNFQINPHDYSSYIESIITDHDITDTEKINKCVELVEELRNNYNNVVAELQAIRKRLEGK